MRIDVHYTNGDGSLGVHSSSVEERWTSAVSAAMGKLVFSSVVWAIELAARDVRVRVIAVDSEGVSGSFLIRATMNGSERHLVYSRRRGAELTAALPIGSIYFTSDQMFTASPLVFQAVCSVLDHGMNAELADGWRWLRADQASAGESSKREYPETDLRTG